MTQDQNNSIAGKGTMHLLIFLSYSAPAWTYFAVLFVRYNITKYCQPNYKNKKIFSDAVHSLDPEKVINH